VITSVAPSPLRSTVLAAIHGSTSVFGYTTPDWLATASAVQPANGLAPDTATVEATVPGPAHAADDPTTKDVAAAEHVVASGA
jgi:hypothetical protein